VCSKNFRSLVTNVSKALVRAISYPVPLIRADQKKVFDPQNPQHLCDLRKTSSTEHTIFFFFYFPLFSFFEGFYKRASSINKSSAVFVFYVASPSRNRRLALGLLHRIIRSECDVLVWWVWFYFWPIRGKKAP